ncbi:hypothetical protein D3C81_1796620 [compost metagenome]
MGTRRWRWQEREQGVVLDLHVEHECLDAEHIAPQQIAIALGQACSLVGETTQHGDLVERADFRSPAAEQGAAGLGQRQGLLQALHGLGRCAHAQGESNQFIQSHGNSL